jgi:hypothetical protein
MMPKRIVSLAFATACLTAIVTMPVYAQTGTYGSTPGYSGQQPGTPPQASQGDVAPSAAARQNVKESREYDRAVETNRGFREARMRKECGPITDPELHQSCLASFNQEEPAGSARSSRGRKSMAPN